MFNKRKAGLNFLQTKYKLLDKSSFVPYVRLNGQASIPYTIIDSFGNHSREVAFLKIYDTDRGDFKFRIKKLYTQGNSRIVSLKSERKIKNIKIEVLNIDSQKNLLKRRRLGVLKFLPQFTSKNTPIYVFDYDSKSYFVGGYYKKDFFINKKVLEDKLFYSFLGLYLAEGGKTAATFTNSWPEAINLVLYFIENNFSIKREHIRAAICCNYHLESKKKELEQFWGDKTGIHTFFRNLHLSKNVKSPQGILELSLNSQTLKELFLNLIRKLDVRNNLDFINGFLSGDGCPILQNKYCITHHIVFDPKRDIFGKSKYSDLFTNFKFNFINKNRLVLYTNWDKNLFLLLNGIYSFSPMKRFKFLKYFLLLPRTKLNENYEIDKLRKEYKDLRLYLINFYKSLVHYNLYTHKQIGKFILKELK